MCTHYMHVHSVMVLEGGVRSKKPVYIGVKALVSLAFKYTDLIR